MTVDVLDRRLHGIAIYNPDLLSKDELIAQFVARRDLLERLLSDLKRPNISQHQVIVGTRGMGKTTLLRRLRFAVDDDPDLAGVWIPLTFPEEQYNVARLSDFFLNIVDALGDALEQRGQKDEAGALDDARDRIARLADEKRTEAAIALLLDTARRLGRRLLLLIDNVDLVLDRLAKQPSAQWAFREFLSRERDVLLIGASPVVLGTIYDYDSPFYDFFQVHELRGLGRAETREVLSTFAREHDAPDVQRLLEEEPERIETLHVLSGGNPRTIVLLFGVLAHGTEGDVRSDLEKLLDQCTPLYKARFEALPQQAQHVVDAVAIHWDPISAGELAEKMSMDVNLVSSQLNRLVQQGVIEKVEYEPDTKTGFQIAERFFNIWYLMRASRRVRRRLVWLVQFLRLFYGSEKLVERARGLLQDRSVDSLRRIELYLAFAEALREHAPIQAALEIRAVDALFRDDALRDQIGSILDLDGSDAQLKPAIDRNERVKRVRAAIENLELPEAIDRDELCDLVTGSLVPYESQVGLAEFRGDFAELLTMLRDMRSSMFRTLGRALTETAVRARREGFDLNDAEAIHVASLALHMPELRLWKPEALSIEELDELVTRGFSVACAARAHLFTADGNFAEAERLLRRAENDPCLFVDDSRAMLLRARGLHEEARVLMKRVVNVEPRYRRGWGMLAELAEAAGDLQAAGEAYAEASSTADSDALVKHAEFLLRVNRPADAEDRARRAIDGAPTLVAAQHALFQSLLAQQKYADIDAWGEQARTALTQNDIDSFRVLARVVQNRVTDAVSLLHDLRERDLPPAQEIVLASSFILGAGWAEAARSLETHLPLAESDEIVREAAMDALTTAGEYGFAAPAADLIAKLDLIDQWRPLYEALRIQASGNRNALRRLAPEIRVVANKFLDRWPEPEAKKPAKTRPRRKP